jgi:hypothetical protein
MFDLDALARIDAALAVLAARKPQQVGGSAAK